MTGLLEDAYNLATDLRDTLEAAAADLASNQAQQFAFIDLEVMRDDADDLASRIDNKRTALRGS